MDLKQQSSVWRDLAEQARSVAVRLADLELRRHMLIVAAGYEGLAQRAEVLAATLTNVVVANSNEPDAKPIA
jgi:hypothetical protein